MATAVLALRLLLAGVFLCGHRKAPRSARLAARGGGLRGSRASGPRRGPAASARRDRDRGLARPRSSARWGARRGDPAGRVHSRNRAGAIAWRAARLPLLRSDPLRAGGALTLARNAALLGCAAVIVVYGSGPAVDAWVNARSTSELVAAGAAICAVAAVAYALSLRAEIARLKRTLTSRKRVPRPPPRPAGRC